LPNKQQGKCATTTETATMKHTNTNLYLSITQNTKKLEKRAAERNQFNGGSPQTQ